LISAPWGIAMTNDTAVFDALRLDPNSGLAEWAGRLGTREAIRSDGLEIDAASLSFCPHEWIDPAGYVDLQLVRQFPRMLAV
jgi:hypothetical protein